MSLPDPFLPEHMREPMRLYLEHGIEPGGFLYSVLTNDLTGAVARADSENQRHLAAIVSYVNNEIPSNAWGDADTVNDWMNRLGRAK